MRSNAQGLSLRVLAGGAGAALLLFDGGADERGKERVWREGLGLELRVELTAEEPGMIRRFDDFHVMAVGRSPSDFQAGADQGRLVIAIELVAMAVALADVELAVGAMGERSRCKLAGPRAQTHGATISSTPSSSRSL